LGVAAALSHVKKYSTGAYGETVFLKVGSMALGVIIPETAKRGELEIARFETTQAEFAQFQELTCMAKAKQVDRKCTEVQQRVSGTRNFPQAGTSLEDANAYVAWLSHLTNQVWRLPYEDEVKALYENREGENTLDYWAGYAPNPEDTAKLREKAKDLGGTAPLLKEVGSFAGKGKDDEEPIYDLGGNVAEWVLTRDGKGKVTGGSADCPADARANCTAAPEYVGFRVVRGAAKPTSPAQ
jgi:formylglycine-generating enzyme required for sulfatase activity